MRLLHVQSRRLHTFYDDDIPPYAALSHTWDLQEPEVSFADMDQPDHQQMKAYHKIEMTCRLAEAQGLLWVWIDTCCIDKSSSAELSEAINSMFQWYQSSKACYVHLEDLPARPVTPGADFDFDSTFQACRWFSRGWTLQELLAPRRLLFFDATWAAVGDRHSLADLVWRRTNIPVEYLQTDRQDFHKARVGQRMSWASDRNTTRKEDMAYCLLGIFDINMPLLYGEGHRAFRRLQDEILKTSTDDSIFAWTTGDSVPNMGGLGGEWPEEENEPRTPLAPSPHAFRCLRHCAMPYFWRPEKTWETTSDGIRIHLPICSPGARPNRHYSRRREQCKVGLLNCALGGNTNKHLAIVFRRNGRGNDWERITLCTVNWEHLAAARRDTLDVREPGTDAIHEVNSGENWLRLDGLLINIVASGDRIVAKHIRDYLTTWIRMGLHIRKGGLEEPEVNSDYLILVERRTVFWALWFVGTPICEPVTAHIVGVENDMSIQKVVEAPHLAFPPEPLFARRAKHRDLRLLGTFTHVVEIEGPGMKPGVIHTNKRPGVPAVLLVSESPPEELYLALFAAFICLALVSEKATQAQSRAHIFSIMLPPLILVLSSHWRLLRVALVDTDKTAQRHRQELRRWIWAHRAEFFMTQYLYSSYLVAVYFTCSFVGLPSWSLSYIWTIGPGFLLWAKLLGAVISIHHPQLGARARMLAKRWLLQPIAFMERCELSCALWLSEAMLMVASWLRLAWSAVELAWNLATLMTQGVLPWFESSRRLLAMLWRFLSGPRLVMNTKRDSRRRRTERRQSTKT